MASPFTDEQLADLERRIDEDRTGEIRAAYIAPIPVILISTALRLWSKKSGSHKITLDDYLIILASISAIGVCVSGLVYGPPYGFGRHINAVSEEDLRMFQKGNYIFSHFYNVALGTVKLAILAFYYRIFSIPTFRKVVIFSGVFIALWLLSITVVLALHCRPIEGFWDARVEAECFDLVAFTYFTNITNLITDVWIFFLPIPVIVRLHVDLSRKIALCAIFLIGLGVCIISAVRLKFAVTQGSPDFTWEGVPLGALSAFEPMSGILCANLPLIYHLFTKTMHRFKSFRSMLSSYTRKSSLFSGKTHAGSNKNFLSSRNNSVDVGRGGGGGGGEKFDASDSSLNKNAITTTTTTTLAWSPSTPVKEAEDELPAYNVPFALAAPNARRTASNMYHSAP